MCDALQPLGMSVEQQLCRCQRHPLMCPSAAELWPGGSSHLEGRPYSADLPEWPGPRLQQQVGTLRQGIPWNALGELLARCLRCWLAIGRVHHDDMSWTTCGKYDGFRSSVGFRWGLGPGPTRPGSGMPAALLTSPPLYASSITDA